MRVAGGGGWAEERDVGDGAEERCERAGLRRGMGGRG